MKKQPTVDELYQVELVELMQQTKIKGSDKQIIKMANNIIDSNDLLNDFLVDIEQIIVDEITEENLLNRYLENMVFWHRFLIKQLNKENYEIAAKTRDVINILTKSTTNVLFNKTQNNSSREDIDFIYRNFKSVVQSQTIKQR